MSKTEREPRENEPHVVRLGETFQMRLRPIDPKDRMAYYPHFFEDEIVIPEIKARGALSFYADGAVAINHVTPLGPIKFNAVLSGNSVGFDEKSGELLMLALDLSGQEGIGGRKLIVSTETGTYVSHAQMSHSGVGDELHLRAGGHTWNSAELAKDIEAKIIRVSEKRHVTAYFPNHIGKLHSPRVTII